ncbi:MAG: helix-turn-helix domain-containing protein [Desertifilum sp.]|nr:helix-turn-helix domain-containing protein [Desertifilum sp.]
MNELFKITQDRHGVSAKDLAADTGISPQHISEFRSGKTDMTCSKLFALLRSLNQRSPGALNDFCNLLLQELGAERQGKLEALINRASEAELEEAMILITRRIFSRTSPDVVLGDNRLKSRCF